MPQYVVDMWRYAESDGLPLDPLIVVIRGVHPSPGHPSVSRPLDRKAFDRLTDDRLDIVRTMIRRGENVGAIEDRLAADRASGHPLDGLLVGKVRSAEELSALCRAGPRGSAIDESSMDRLALLINVWDD